MVLLTTIMMLLMMASFVLSLTHAMLAWRMSLQALDERMLHEAHLEQATSHIAQQLSLTTTKSCFRRSKQEIVRPCRWHEDDKYYHYWITDLGSFPCVKTHHEGTHHWFVDVQPLHARQMMLHVRVAIKEPLLVCRLATHAMIEPGIISWIMANE
jgi:hypothetical protein